MKPVRLCLLVLPFFAAAAPAAAQAPRACTEAELSGVRKPLVVEERNAGRSEPELLVAGRAYRAVTVQESAYSDTRSPQPASFAVSAPEDVALTRDDVDGRPAWAFTAPESGPLTLTLTWSAASDADASDVCQASRSVTLPVRAVTPVAVGKGRLITGRKLLADAFELPLRAPKLTDASPVTVLLRIRTSTTTPPATSGPATVRATLRPSSSGGFSGGSGLGPKWLRKLDLHVDVDERRAQIYADPNIAFGTRLRFGFSIEVRQDGRRAGGYASGAVCRRVQYPDYSLVRCRAVGARQL